MAAEKGRSFVLKLGDGTSSEAFTTIAGCKVTGFNFSGEDVDIGDKDDAGWQVLLADAGKKAVSLTISGVFKDSAVEALLAVAAIAQTIDNYELHFESGDKYAGAWQVSGLEYSGAEVGELTFTCNLSSSGVIGFTAA